MHAIESYTVQNIDKSSYAMYTIKITHNLLFEYRCTSGKFIRLPNRIESKLFLPELECSTTGTTLSSKLAARCCCCRSMRQTDGRTDGRAAVT